MSINAPQRDEDAKAAMEHGKGIMTLTPQRDEDAKAAMEHGKGTMILGRACRTEMVKANRMLSLSPILAQLTWRKEFS